MKNFIFSLLSVLLIMITTQPLNKPIKKEPAIIEKQMIINAIQPTVYAQKQEVASIPVAQPGQSTQETTKTNADWVEQCHVWANQAGITLNSAAIKLLERESHCNPLARNPTSSAGGIPQALPWTKMGCPLSNEGAPCQLRWFNRYVIDRYGSYESALAHSYAVSWY